MHIRTLSRACPSTTAFATPQLPSRARALSTVVPRAQQNAHNEPSPALSTILETARALSPRAEMNRVLGHTPPPGAALIQAAEAGNVAQAKALIANKVDLNAESEFGENALFTAAMAGHLGMVQLLVGAGMDPGYGGSIDIPPVAIAISMAKHDVREFLMELGERTANHRRV